MHPTHLPLRPSPAPLHTPHRKPFVITPDTKVKFQTFSLPSNGIVRWRVFRPASCSLDPPDPLRALDLARREISQTYQPLSLSSQPNLKTRNILTTSLLCHLRPLKPTGTSGAGEINQEESPASGIDHPTRMAEGERMVLGELWVFAVGVQEEDDGLCKQLNDLTFDGLLEHSTGIFHPSTLYPSSTNNASSSNTLELLQPHPHFQIPYTVFLLSARERIIEELTSPLSTSMRGQGVRAVRCKNGVVVLPWEEFEEKRNGWRRGKEWGKGWNVRPGERRPWDLRSTIHLTFALHLLPAPQNLLLFLPQPTRIPYVPSALPISLPTPGAPIPVLLLPMGTQAFFLRSSPKRETDRGRQAERAFWDALKGKGVGGSVGVEGARKAGWVVCWVPVEGETDEEEKKGVVCSWPGDLILFGSTGVSPSSPSTSSSAMPSSSSIRGGSFLNERGLGGAPILTSAFKVNLTSSLKPYSTSSLHSPSLESPTTSSLSSATMLPTFKLASAWKTLTSSSSRHYASSFPSPPPSSPLPNPVSFASGALAPPGSSIDHQRVIDPQDPYFEIAASGVNYLDSLVREREKERERLEEEREREKRRKDGLHPGGGEYFGVLKGRSSGLGLAAENMEADDAASDDLWGSDSGGDNQAEVGKPLVTPSLHLPSMASSSASALPDTLRSSINHPNFNSSEAHGRPDNQSRSGFTPLSVHEQQLAAADLGNLMDWTWESSALPSSLHINMPAASVTTPQPASFGTSSSSNAFNLRLPNHRRQQEEPAWAPVDAVTEDDFDFFDSAPSGGVGGVTAVSTEEAMSLGGVAEIPSDPHLSGFDLNVQPAQPSAAVLGESSFVLSPLPSHMVGLTASGSTGSVSGGGPFSPTDVEMMNPNSPQIIHGLNHASPLEGSLCTGGSPGASSWNHLQSQQARTPKTPKTPFSPFVEINEESEDDDDDDDEGEGEGDGWKVDVGRRPSGFGGGVKQEEIDDSVGLVETFATTVGGKGFIPPGFEPVPFGKVHALADGKYEVGKFAFPSPVSLVSSEEEGADGYGMAGFRSKASGAIEVDKTTSKKRRFSEIPLPSVRKGASWRENLEGLASFGARVGPFSTQPQAPAKRTGGWDPSSLPTPTLLADLRLHYDQIADPKVGVIYRLKTRSQQKRLSTSEAEACLPRDFQRRLQITKPNFSFERARVEDEQGSDKEWDVEDLLAFKTWGFSGNSPKDELDLEEGDADALQAGVDFLPYLSNEIPPSPSQSLSFTLSSLSPANPTAATTSAIGPLLAPTPLPQTAGTPAWAPTPTSPPLGSAPKETTEEDVATLGAWLAKEAVENPLLVGELKFKMRKSADWPDQYDTLSLDIDPIASILNNLATETSKPPYTLQSLTDLNAPPLAASTPSMETLQSPRFTIGCQGGIIKTSPLALRFWPKLGLFPAGGQKDVVAFAIYESTGPGMNAKVSAWLSKVGSTYEALRLGKHTAGTAAGVAAGLVAVDNAHLLDFIYPIISELSVQVPHVVFYLISPRYLSSTSFSLRDIQSQLSAGLSTLQNPALTNRFLSHIIPTSLVLDEPSQARDQPTLFTVCLSVYDRLQRNVDRLVPRPLFAASSLSKSFQFPAFHISKARPPVAEFSLTWPCPSLNILDKQTFLHLAYRLSPNKEWLTACVVDERGQSYELMVWRLGKEPFTYGSVVSKLWEFFTKISSQAEIEWRMVVTKLGLMACEEISAWEKHISTQLLVITTPTQVHITCFDPTFPPPFLSDPTSASRTSSFQEVLAHSLSRFDGTDTFVDTSSTTLGIYPSYRIPYTPSTSDTLPSGPPHRTTTTTTLGKPLLSDAEPVYTQATVLPLSNFTILSVPSVPFINSLNPPPSFSTTPPARATSTFTLHHLLSFLSPSTSAPAFSISNPSSDFRRDLAGNLHSLSVLAHERWGNWDLPLKDHLPLHLAAVARMCSVVDLVRRGEYGL